jgi:hypothetical protein
MMSRYRLPGGPMASVVVFPKPRSVDQIRCELKSLQNIKQAAEEQIQLANEMIEELLRDLRIRERVS